MRLLDSMENLDLIVTGAMLTRKGEPLYPRLPAHSFTWTLLGHNKVCHQAMLYRRDALRRVGDFNPKYPQAADYEHYFRCLIEGLRVRCLRKELVDFDMDGTSNDYHNAFKEFKTIHRDLAPKLPTWVNIANEIFRTLELAKVATMKRLRPLWVRWNRLFNG